MDQELKAYFEENFGRMRDQMAEQFGQVREQFGQVREEFEQVKTAIRHTQISVEAVHSDVRLVAEGVMGLTERLENFQGETALRFEDVKASIVPYYTNLNSRMKILESWADRQTDDVLEAIRKKFGKPQA